MADFDDDRTLAGDDPSVRPPAPAAGSPTRITRGVSLGRYVVLEQLGSGGMGVVYAAFDPQLDRKVALKLLHTVDDDRGGSQASAGAPRLLREAQALAKLAHPNVITIHDVGTVEGAVFLAMEFIEGPTLGGWARERRSWREVVSMYAAAGRGIAAAHRAGIVHRDFKPDNVMIGKDGRPRVLDFGLARTADASTSRDLVPALLDEVSLVSTARSLDTKLTMTGAVMGTPAYMAPEQHYGRAVDERSDQFAFCVSLYEALYGERPFAGTNLAALALAVTSGDPREAPAQSEVPAWLRKIVLRGLAREPEQRWPSMDALLDALARDPTRRRRAWLAGVTGLGLVIGLGVAGSRMLVTPQPCTGAEQHLVGVWDLDTRTSLRAGFEASGAVFAAEAFHGFATTLDAYALAWTGMHGEACEATRVRGEQSDEVLGLRMACLERSRAQLAALVEVYRDPDIEAVERSLEAAASLPPLDACADVEGLLLGVRPPATPELAAAVEALRTPIDRARSLALAGKFKAASEAIGLLMPEVEATGYRPLIAEAELTRGTALQNPAEQVAALERATWMAEASRHDRVAAQAWIQLVKVHGAGTNEFAQAFAAAKRADAAIERLGGDEELRILLDVARGQLLSLLERDKEALALLRPARAARVARGQAGTPQALGEVVALTNALLGASAIDEARALLKESLAQAQQSLGHDHPWVARLEATLGRVEYRRGDYPEAEQHLRAALAVFERHGGHDSPNVGGMLNGLALVLDEQRRFDEAMQLYERAREIFVTHLGARHLNVGKALNNMGALEFERGRVERARELLAEGLEITRERLGEDSSQVAWGRVFLADADARLDHHELAVGGYRQALAFAYGPQAEPELAVHAMTGLAQLAVQRGEPTEARRWFELADAASDLLGSSVVGARSLARQDFAFAKLLAEQGETARARALGRRAGARYLAMTDYYQPEREAIAAWLASLPPE